MASSGGSNNWIARDGISAIPALDADALIGLLCRKLCRRRTAMRVCRHNRLSIHRGLPKRLSGDVDFDLFWFGFLALWQMNREHAILERGLNFACVCLVGKTEAAHKTSVSAFHSMVFL